MVLNRSNTMLGNTFNNPFYWFGVAALIVVICVLFGKTNQTKIYFFYSLSAQLFFLPLLFSRSTLTFTLVLILWFVGFFFCLFFPTLNSNSFCKCSDAWRSWRVWTDDLLLFTSHVLKNSFALIRQLNGLLLKDEKKCSYLVFLTWRPEALFNSPLIAGVWECLVILTTFI